MSSESVVADEIEAPADAAVNRRVSRRWLALLGVLLAVAAAYTGGYLTPALRAPGDHSPEAGFARDMSTHHAQAVDMAMMAYPKATLPEVRILAADIAMTQENQIGVMHTWLLNWHDSVNSLDPPMSWMPDGPEALHDGLMPGMATPQEMDKLRNATGKDVDILFCQLMLRHHLGGIHMVDGVLAVSHNQQVRDLATAMKTGQSGEVEVMHHLLDQLGAKPLS
ncbi:MAG TPA: DUF305 domain-containing protein [Micromonosporaceae bacterium]